MKKLLLIVAAVIAISGCIDKEDTNVTPVQSQPTTGTIQFINNSQNPYDVFVDGTHVFQQSGKTTRDHSVSAGSHKVKVQQVSGYVLYPTVKEYEPNVTASENIVVSYP